MTNRLRRLLEEKNEKFMEQFAKSETYNEALVVIQEFLPDYSLEEMHSDLKKLNEIPEDEFLDSEELAGVAGGAGSWGDKRFDFKRFLHIDY
jgi:hypothetical protein